jgi:opacity protein-like surface antigen
MKSKLFLATALSTALFATTASAQEGLNLSVKAIAANSTLLNSDDSDLGALYDRQFTLAPAFGLGVGYGFTDNLGIGLDVIYSMQGQRYEVLGAERFQKSSYLKIPLLFVYNTDPSKSVMFIGKVGPQLGLLTSAKLSDNDGNDLVGDNTDRYSSTDFGAVVSLGVGFGLSDNLRLTAALRGDYGFTNAEDEDAPFYPAGRATTNNLTTGLEVGLTYLLN